MKICPPPRESKLCGNQNKHLRIIYFSSSTAIFTAHHLVKLSRVSKMYFLTLFQIMIRDHCPHIHPLAVLRLRSRDQVEREQRRRAKLLRTRQAEVWRLSSSFVRVG